MHSNKRTNKVVDQLEHEMNNLRDENHTIQEDHGTKDTYTRKYSEARGRKRRIFVIKVLSRVSNRQQPGGKTVHFLRSYILKTEAFI